MERRKGGGGGEATVHVPTRLSIAAQDTRVTTHTNNLSCGVVITFYSLIVACGSPWAVPRFGAPQSKSARCCGGGSRRSSASADGWAVGSCCAPRKCISCSAGRPGCGWKTKNVWGGQSGADISERDWVPLHVCVNVALIEEGTLRVGAVSVLMVSVLLSIPF
jgi:hypothetical protein